MTTEHTRNRTHRRIDKASRRSAARSPAKAATSTISIYPACSIWPLQRSPYPHAKIISIDTSKAKAMPGVEAGRHRQRLER